MQCLITAVNVHLSKELLNNFEFKVLKLPKA